MFIFGFLTLDLCYTTVVCFSQSEDGPSARKQKLESEKLVQSSKAGGGAKDAQVS